MSNASPLESQSRHRAQTTPRRVLGLPVKFVGFWTAVFVPFVLLALIASGAVLQAPQLFAALLGANLVGLVVGRDYKR